MAVRFMKTKKKISVGTTPGIKYLAKIVYGETVSLEQLSEFVAEASAMTEGDIYNVLVQSQNVIIRLLTDGVPVDLGRFGRFYPRFNAKAMSTYEEVTAETISNFTARFLPSPYFRKKLVGTKFEFHEVPKSYVAKPIPAP
ncbi:MAG: hypothetical protein WC679_07545 [Bacteroidales bacterium]|jgi:predicted histone-like DNA-binding protein